MIDLGISKLALIGAVALIVIGPEKLPRISRTVGTLLGKAQRYVSDVKAEVNRSIELDELRKAKTAMEDAARGVEQSVQSTASEVEQSWTTSADDTLTAPPSFPEYRHPGKNWRLKRGAVPTWYKARQGVRTRAQSGAARVARHRPQR
jgi:sec-independent protein translocase protein TatB